MDRRIWLLGLAAALLLSPVSFAPAFAQNVGDPCTGTDRQYTISGPGSSALVCNGSTLELLGKDLSNPVRKGIGTATPEATLDIAGEVKFGNTSLACSGTTEGAMRYNSTSKELEYCNGTAWASLYPAAGSPVPTYAGKTPTSYNGAMGGMAGATAKCVAAFPGSRMMRVSDFVFVAQDISTTEGWAFDDVAPGSTLGIGGCYSFSSSSGSVYGVTINATGTGWARACSSSYGIHCVTD